MSQVEIRERDFNAFFNAPLNAYGKDSLFVSQMKGDIKRFINKKNPLFKEDDDFTFYTAHRHGKAIGRILVHQHRASNEKYGKKQAYFGYFDVADDFEAAQMLMEWAEGWAKGKGFDELIGNFNMTAMQQMGVMIDGFENAPYIDFIWNGPHVPKFLDKLGYERDFFVNTYEIDVNRVDIERLLSKKAKNVLEGDEYEFAELNKKKITPLLEEIRQVLNDGFSENPMFVPLSKEEMEFQAKDLSLIMDERITALIRKDGKSVGTIVSIPDLNPFLKATGSKIGWKTPIEYWKALKNRKRALLIFASVNRDQHSSGLSSAMLVHIVQELRKAGYEKLGVTWVWEKNKPVHVLMERMGGEKLHHLCLFKKALEPTA